MDDESKTKAQLIEELRSLRSAEQRNQELAEEVRLLKAFQGIAQATISSLETQRVLDSLAQHVIQAGVFRSLMVALVNDEAQHVEVVRNYLSVAAGADRSDLPTDEKLAPGGVLTPVLVSAKKEGPAVWSEKIVGTRYPLDDDNTTSVVARTGEMMVIDGWDDRFDERVTDREDISRNVSYFLPVKLDDRVVAVLATGSPQADKDATLRRIETMQPLLDQVAIALEHARLYEAAQREIAARKGEG